MRIASESSHLEISSFMVRYTYSSFFRRAFFVVSSVFRTFSVSYSSCPLSFYSLAVSNSQSGDKSWPKSWLYYNAAVILSSSFFICLLARIFVIIQILMRISDVCWIVFVSWYLFVVSTSLSNCSISSLIALVVFLIARVLLPVLDNIRRVLEICFIFPDSLWIFFSLDKILSSSFFDDFFIINDVRRRFCSG